MSSTDPSQFYQHPGYAFLNQYGSLQSEADILDYVNFLRQRSGLDDRIPVDLDRIFRQFGMPIPLRVPLDDDQQGILLDSDRGVILIREGDPIERQRFTEGHELMELLFDAQDAVAQELQLTPWDEARKEKLCDLGAAELLMPAELFQRHLAHLGTSLNTGRSLARLYGTSLMATLIRMVQLTQGEHALVVWQVVHNAEGERLRTEWSMVSPSWQQGFIPKSHFMAADRLLGDSTSRSRPRSKRPGSKRPVTRAQGRSIDSRVQLELDDWSLSCRAEIWHLNGKDHPSILSFLHL